MPPTAADNTKDTNRVARLRADDLGVGVGGGNSNSNSYRPRRSSLSLVLDLKAPQTFYLSDSLDDQSDVHLMHSSGSVTERSGRRQLLRSKLVPPPLTRMHSERLSRVQSLEGNRRDLLRTNIQDYKKQLLKVSADFQRVKMVAVVCATRRGD
jgi:hypothetical protein